MRLAAEKAQEVEAHSHTKAMLARTQKELAEAQERANTERAKSAELVKAHMKAAELAEERSSLEKEELAEVELRSELALAVGRVALLTGALETQAALSEEREAKRCPRRSDMKLQREHMHKRAKQQNM